MRVLGICMGVLTFFAGIIGTIEILLLPMPLIAFISYLLCASDDFYLRHPSLITAGGAITAIVGLGLIMAPCLHPRFQESSLGAFFYTFLFFFAGLLALADAGVLFARRRGAQLLRK